MLDVLVKFPTRSRPLIFRQRLIEYLADPIVSVLVTADLDDATMNTPAMRDFLTRDRVMVRWGECCTKVQAVNDGLAEHPWDGLLILASDDMVPQYDDYAQRIAALYDEFWPEGDGVLHLNDGRVGRKLNTLPIMDFKYFSRTNTIYHPAYLSVYCDNEFQEVSERLGRSQYVNECIIRHDWIGETHPRDALHRYNESFYAADARTFTRRKAAGFPA